METFSPCSFRFPQMTLQLLVLSDAVSGLNPACNCPVNPDATYMGSFGIHQGE